MFPKFKVVVSSSKETFVYSRKCGFISMQYKLFTRLKARLVTLNVRKSASTKSIR